MSYVNQTSAGTLSGSGSTYGPVATAPDPVHGGNPVSNARSRIGDSVERVNNATARIAAMADDLYGAEPSSSASGASQPRCGEFGLLHDQIDLLSEALDRLENQLGRLNGLQPLNQIASGGPAISRVR